MAYPELKKYNGPYSRVRDAIGEIAEKKTYGAAKAQLAPYGLTIRMFAKKGYRTMFCICEADKEGGEPPEDTQFFEWWVIEEFTRQVRTGELNLAKLTAEE